MRALLAILLLIWGSSPAWADTKISALPNAAALGGTEQIPAVQSAGNVALTPTQLDTYITGTITGDCTISGSFVITCAKTGGVAFAPSATTDATNASNISSGMLSASRLPALKASYIWTIPSNATASNGTTVFEPNFPWSSGTVTSVDYGTNGTATPSFMASVQIGGVNVTSCSGLSVSSSSNTNVSCTASNSLSSGNVVSIIITSVAGAPKQAWVKVNFTHSAN